MPSEHPFKVWGPQKNKDFKILGVSYGLIGDLVMGLPVLTYFEKKYPGSYKYWFIEKKVAFCAPLFLNHPLIDCIRITGEWNGFSKEDFEIADTCQVKCTMTNWKHEEPDWYNYRSCIDETARVAGIYDIEQVLTKEELYPKLYKWFDVGPEDPNLDTYSKENKEERFDRTIAIWPFAAGAKNLPSRNASVTWWGGLMAGIEEMGYRIAQFGHTKESIIWPHVTRYNPLSFFEQVKIALGCKMVIGTDSGNMWVMGAYNHPAIHLLTNWLPGHITNCPLSPLNKKGTYQYELGGTENIKHEDVLREIERMMGGTK